MSVGGKRRIAVVGAGPAGLSFATSAAGAKRLGLSTDVGGINTI